MDGFGQGFADAFRWVFYLAILGVLLGVIGVCYATYSWFFDNEVLISTKRIVPELKLTVKDNKVDTLYIYKQQK